MAGDVRHFEIPYVKAYLAKRFHMTTFGWKLNDMPRNGNAMVIVGPSDARRMSTKGLIRNGGVLEQSASIEFPTASISVDDLDKVLERGRQESGDVVHEKQFIYEMG